jgi:alpha-1,6-mannosyltransferase
MRIVHVANFYGPNSGGIKTTLHELGKGYLAHGHEFIYVVPGPMYLKEQTPFGLKISLPSITLIGSGGYQIIRSNKQLLNLLDFLHPDRVEVSDRFTLLKVGKWARKNKVATVVFSHETLDGLIKKYAKVIPPTLRTKFVDWHNNRLANNFDQVIATTNFAAAEFERIDIPNLTRVALGVDLDEFNPKNRDLALRKELLKGARYLLVHCGRLSPEKDPARSVQAVKVLVKAGVDVKLVIVGGGPLWKKIRSESKDLPIEMLGYVANRKKVAAYLAAADVAIAPGPLETFCLSALESLASGTPVVASNTGAVGEILNVLGEAPAGLVASNDGRSFADAINNLLRDSSLRVNARRQAERYPWNKMVTKMLEIHGQQTTLTSTKRKLKVA